jgi:hypothetical protein
MGAIDVTMATCVNFINLIVAQKSINYQNVGRIYIYLIFARRLEHKARGVTESTRQEGVYESVYIFPFVGYVSYSIKCVWSISNGRLVWFLVSQQTQYFPFHVWKLPFENRLAEIRSYP